MDREEIESIAARAARSHQDRADTVRRSVLSVLLALEKYDIQFPTEINAERSDSNSYTWTVSHEPGSITASASLTLSEGDLILLLKDRGRGLDLTLNVHVTDETFLLQILKSFLAIYYEPAKKEEKPAESLPKSDLML